MRSTVRRWRDRAGHAVVLLLCASATASAAGSYVARRFDVYATVQNGGALDVRETVQFEFLSGSFSKVWREIPRARTDRIDVLDAGMDGQTARPTVTSGSPVRVEWQFPQTGPSSHTFVLHYVVHGVVYRDGNRDVLRWRALPIEHAYGIDASRITIHANEPNADPPKGEAHRAVLNYVHAIPSGGVDIEAGPIRPNGWIVAEVRFGGSRVAAMLPDWQRRQEHAAALAPRWETIGAALFVAALLVLAFARQGYPATSIRSEETTSTDPPSDIPAAAAAVLASNGRYPPYAAATTLIDLADRGALSIRELSRRFGVRNFEIAQIPGAHDLATHEAAALAIAFDGGSGPVSLAGARRRLARKGGTYRAALTTDLIEHGYIDPARRAVRQRVGVIAFTSLMLGAVSAAGAAAFVPTYGAWVFFLPAALVVAGFIGLIMAATLTPLSDAALVEAARWRGYRRHLKEVAKDPDLHAPQGVPSRWIIYGVALGLALQWARYLRKHPDVGPPWCVALQDDSGAFAALIGSHAGGAASGGGGGAAGGGSSGAA